MPVVVPSLVRGWATPKRPSSLLASLQAWWKLDETSGTRYDSHGTNHLTDNNTVGVAAGKKGNAANFVAANSEYLSIASNASVQTGDIDWTVACWVKLASKSATRHWAGKNQTNEHEWGLRYFITPDRLALRVSTTGSSSAPYDVRLNANTLGSPSTGVWYCVIAWHDAASDLIGISVNNGAADTLACVGGYAGGGALNLGALASGAFWDGDLDEFAYWKKLLSADEKAAYYNGANGVSHSDL